MSTTRPEIGPNDEIRQWTPDSMFRTSYVYEIFAPGGIDVNASLGSGSPYPEQLEITFPGGIRREFIRSVRVYEGDNLDELTEIILNPYFQGASDLPNIIIPEGVNVRMWNENESFSSKERSKTDVDEATDPMKVPGHVEKDPYKDDLTNPKRIPDGEYTIKSSIKQNVVADVSKVDVKAPVQAYEYLGQLQQKWLFTYDKNYRAYYIKNKQNSSLLLTATLPGTDGDVWLSDAPLLTSLWRPEPTKDGYYKLRNYYDPKMVLDLDNGGTSNGNKIHVVKESTNPEYIPNQKWKISPVSYKTIEDGEYTINSSINQNVLVDLSSNQPYSLVHAFEYRGANNQKWQFTYKKDYKSYVVKSVQNPQLLLNWSGPDVNVDTAGLLSALWRPELTEDGYYKLRNYSDPKMVLDLDGGGTGNRNKIHVVKESTNPQYMPNQKLFLNRVDQGIVSDGEYIISTKLNYKKVIDFYQDKDIIVLNSNWHLGTAAWEFRYNSTKKAYKIYTYLYGNKGLYYQGNNFNVSVGNIETVDESDLRPYWTIEYNVSKGGYIIRSLHDPTQVLTLNILDNYYIINTSINDSNYQIWNLMTGL